MSQAEELLNTLEETYPGTEGHIVIGSDRYIVVPEELKRIAVQHDHAIETVTFDCPRYWDDHDMSSMTIYINYMTAGGMIGTFRAENVSVDETDSAIMHFDWTITRNVTLIPGKIVFLVCVKKTDTDGIEKNHWNSELCKDCYVSEGLECDEETIVELLPDLVTQWYLEITGNVNAVIEDLNVRRESGEFNGATFTPSLSESGDVSWTNDKGLDNPATVNIHGKDGVSTTVEVADIQGGHKVTFTDVNGSTSINVMDTYIDASDAVTEMLNRLIYVGEEEPTYTPVLWFDTVDTSEGLSNVLVQSILEDIENGAY